MQQQDESNLPWIVLYQTPHDTVRYLIPGLQKPVSLPIKKFMVFLYHGFYIKDKEDFLLRFSRFNTIYVNNFDGSHTVIERPEQFPTFGELLRLNEKAEVKNNAASDVIAKFFGGSMFVKKAHVLADETRNDLDNLYDKLRGKTSDAAKRNRFFS